MVNMGRDGFEPPKAKPADLPAAIFKNLYFNTTHVGGVGFEPT